MTQKIENLLRIILSQLEDIENGWSMDELMQPIGDSIKEIKEVLGEKG